MKFLTLVFVLALSTSAFACGESSKTSDSSVKTDTSTQSTSSVESKKKNSTEG
jgi:ABC-type glycerol-3-phosphate transport system substrate-binding protein